MLPITPLNPQDKTPLFRQLHAQMKDLIESGAFAKGSRLPATRELAGQIGLNRTTVSAAYALLESEGLITGHVGRGSFVSGTPLTDVRGSAANGSAADGSIARASADSSSFSR